MRVSFNAPTSGQRFQGIKQNDVAAFHIRASGAVRFVPFPAKAFAFEHRIDVSE